MPGADSKMNTIELVKNWQAEKAKEAQYQNDMKARAREAARPQAEKIMMQRYQNEALHEMTADKSVQAKEKLRSGLGIDLDKAASRENLAYMTGNKNVNVNGGNTNMFNKDNLQAMAGGSSSDKIFDKSKIAAMSQSNISSEKLRNAASSNINWDGGVKKALRNENQMSGIDKALYGNRKQ